jgi:hypothetical protein
MTTCRPIDVAIAAVTAGESHRTAFQEAHAKLNSVLSGLAPSQAPPKSLSTGLVDQAALDGEMNQLASIGEF